MIKMLTITPVALAYGGTAIFALMEISLELKLIDIEYLLVFLSVLSVFSMFWLLLGFPYLNVLSEKKIMSLHKRKIMDNNMSFSWHRNSRYESKRPLNY